MQDWRGLASAVVVVLRRGVRLASFASFSCSLRFCTVLACNMFLLHTLLLFGAGRNKHYITSNWRRNKWLSFSFSVSSVWLAG